MLFDSVIGGPMLYKMPTYSSSEIFVTQKFFGAYVFTLSTAISRDWSKIETIWNHFCQQSRLCPIDWCHCRADHVTILLPVWRFWPFGVIKTVGNGGNGDVPGRETCQILGHREIEGGGGKLKFWPPPLSPPWGVLESAIFGVVGPEGAYLSSKHGVPPVVLQSKISCRPMTKIPAPIENFFISTILHLLAL